MGAALENMFSGTQAAAFPLLVPSPVGFLSESERVDQAGLTEAQDLKVEESAPGDEPSGPQTALDDAEATAPRARVRQLQRPRKRPRRCDVCEKDFKSIGKMQAHRYEADWIRSLILQKKGFSENSFRVMM